MQVFSRCLLLPAAVGLLAPLLSLGQGWQHIGSVQKVDKLADGVELTGGKAKVRVTVFREGIFRVRLAPNGVFPKDFSWAVIEAPQPPPVKIDETKDEVRVVAGNVIARIHKSPLLIDFLRDTCWSPTIPVSR
jgi:alpha-glucosidase